MRAIPKLLTLEDVCRILGVTRKTVYGWTSRREIPFVKVGSRLRFEEDALATWIEARRIPVFDAEQFAEGLVVHERPTRAP